MKIPNIRILRLPLVLIVACNRTASPGPDASLERASSVSSASSAVNDSGRPSSTSTVATPGTTLGSVKPGEATVAVPPRKPMQPLGSGASGWRAPAIAQSGFYAVLDGLCSDLSVSRLGADALVSYGGTASEMYIDGKRKGAASFVGIHGDEVVQMDIPKMDAPSDIDGTSLDSFWLGDATTGRSGDGRTMHRTADGKWTTAEHSNDVGFHLWLDGGLISNKGYGTQ
jgi:hypothetical protein